MKKVELEKIAENLDFINTISLNKDKHFERFKDGFHITFTVKEPTSNYSCIVNVKICDCIVGCCGVNYNNTIISSEIEFNKYIEFLQKDYLKNKKHGI